MSTPRMLLLSRLGFRPVAGEDVAVVDVVGREVDVEAEVVVVAAAVGAVSPLGGGVWERRRDEGRLGTVVGWVSLPVAGDRIISRNVMNGRCQK